MLRKTRRFVPFCCAALLIAGAPLTAGEGLPTGSPSAQIALWTGASGSADSSRFPGAVADPPEYLTKDAPFNVVEFLKPPQPNAEPLYLDALFEFSSDMQVCFPEEERERRLPEIRRREQAYERIRQALENDAASVDPSQIEALDAAHSEGFRKLHGAQQIPQCKFVTGVGVRALIPHASAARHVARVIDLATIRDIRGGEIDRAIGRLEVALRLSRDLRPGGHLICQLVSTAMDSIVTDNIIRRILSADGLTIEHCDRLLKTVSEHEAQRGDMFVTALKMEYLVLRKLLHDLTYRTGDFGPNWREEWEVGQNVTLGEVVTSLEGASEEERPGLTRAMNNAIKQLSPESLARSVGHMNEAFRRLSQAPQFSYREQLKVAKEVEEYIIESDPFLQVLVPPYPTLVEAFARHQTRLSAARCLIAIRRWALSEKKPLPPDLTPIVTAAGLADVPTDPYSGEPMKLAFIDGWPVVYSVGSDGEDDGGRIDWNLGERPGDFLFSLAPSP